jgi:adenylate kinase
MSSRFKTILLFGAPGAGKGTQGKILGKIPGFFHLACGDVFRSLDLSSDLGKKFLEHSSKGELVPDDLTIEMWRQNVHAQTVLSFYKPAADLLILDGIPRSVNQARAMEPYSRCSKSSTSSVPTVTRWCGACARRALKENRLDDATRR